MTDPNQIVEASKTTMERLTRELRAVSTCNQVLMRANDEPTLLKEVCQIICNQAGYRMAWVGFAEHDSEKTVRPASIAGIDDGYVHAAQITWADTERGRGPIGQAIRTGQPVCFQDFAHDLRSIPWRDEALRHNYHSVASFPLKKQNAETFGALNIYSEKVDAFTPSEMNLLKGLADDLACGITVLRSRIELKQAQEQRLAHLRFLERDRKSTRLNSSH